MQTSAMLQIDAVDGEKPKRKMMALNRVAIIRRILSLKLTQYPRGRIPRNFSVYGTNAGAASNTSTAARASPLWWCHSVHLLMPNAASRRPTRQ